MLLLDTSAAVALREGQPSVLERFNRITDLPALSILSVVELEGGVVAAQEGSQARRRALDLLYTSLDILEFGVEEAAVYRRIISDLGFSRTRIIDRLIASQAVVAGATLATLNVRDFRDISGIKVEDWST